jgi:hypothetical protein
MIASRSRQPYAPAMAPRRLFRLLAMLALLLAPLGMRSGDSAMAMPVAADAAMDLEQASSPSAHCAEMASESRDDDGGSSSGDCLTDCAVACSAIPALGSALAERPMAPAIAQPLLRAGRVRGLHPESADPPPRTA